MSVEDETWDRPICEFCNKTIHYGRKGEHGKQRCVKIKISDVEEPTDSMILSMFSEEQIEEAKLRWEARNKHTPDKKRFVGEF